MNPLLAKRAFAFLLDEAVLFLIVFSPLSAFLGANGSGAFHSFVLAYAQALSILYWSVSDWLIGESFGKRIMKLKTVGVRGSVSLLSALARNFTKPFFPLLLLDSFPLIFGKTGGRVTESLAGTTVLEWT